MLFVVLFAPIAFIPKTCTAQSRVSLRLVSARGRQTASTAPADWDTAVRELVDRIAAIAAPPARTDLLVNNVSSLSPDDAAAIGERLRAELIKQHFRLTGAQASTRAISIWRAVEPGR